VSERIYSVSKACSRWDIEDVIVLCRYGNADSCVSDGSFEINI